MNSPRETSPEAVEMVEVQGEQRWLIYQRLQQLGIICNCSAYQALKIKIVDSATLVQVWSVSRQILLSRGQLAHWLERCWELEGS